MTETETEKWHPAIINVRWVRYY